MSVELYLHTNLPEDVNERQAAQTVARALFERYHRSREVYVLILNVDPWQDQSLNGVTQLDGVLLGPKFVAILEFKKSFDPILGETLDSPWYSLSADGPKELLAGSESNTNPFQQVRKARYLWANHLRRESQRLLTPRRQKDLRLGHDSYNAWSHLSTCILFHPHLHPKSQLPPLESAQLWCHIQSIEQVIPLTYTMESKLLVLTAVERRQLAAEAFHARPWHDNPLGLHNLLGYLYVAESGKSVCRYPLYSYDEFIIGRSSIAAGRGHRLDPQLTIISSLHARLETDGERVYLYDTDSKNGTFVNGRRLYPHLPVQLTDRLFRASLGRPDEKACTVWFEPETATTTASGITTLSTGTFRGSNEQLDSLDLND